jgi:hypothetical protein
VVGTGAVALRRACNLGCDKAVKGVNELATSASSQVSRRVDDLPCNSFVPGTAVLMADGTHKAIEDVAVGELVLAADPISGESGARVVVNTIEGRGDKTLIDVRAGEGVVTATAGHPFWDSARRRWLDAHQLTEGSELVDENGGVVLVASANERSAEDQTVHNLTVADLHTFYVLADTALLTHNTSCRMRVVERVTGIKPRGTSRNALNSAQGAQAEKIGLWTARLRHPLSKVSGTKRKIDTPWGRRFPDIRITSRLTGKTRFWEIKSGASRYSKSQQRKDVWIAQNKGVRTTLRRFGWVRY